MGLLPSLFIRGEPRLLGGRERIGQCHMRKVARALRPAGR
jgi:hypothetical protein